MWRQIASISLLLLIIAVFTIPEWIILPNLEVKDLYWPYLMSMLAAAFVVYITGRQANRREVKLIILNIRFEYWSLIIIGLSAIVYLMYEFGR